MTVLDRLADDSTRCIHGFHPTQRSLHDCPELTPTGPVDHWRTFRAALAQVARHDGTVSQTDMRPLIAGIPHKVRGQMYRKAVAARLITCIGDEPSTDASGRNTDKTQRRYRLRTAA